MLLGFSRADQRVVLQQAPQKQTGNGTPSYHSPGSFPQQQFGALEWWPDLGRHITAHSIPMEGRCFPWRIGFSHARAHSHPCFNLVGQKPGSATLTRETEALQCCPYDQTPVALRLHVNYSPLCDCGPRLGGGGLD